MELPCCCFVRSGGRCVNEDGSYGCIRRSSNYIDYREKASSASSPPPIWLDELTCTGEERELGECQRAGWGVNDCGHKEDAGCICTPRHTGSPGRGFYSLHGRVKSLAQLIVRQ